MSLASTHSRPEIDRSLSATVVICTHDAERWPALCRAVGSVRAQLRPAHQIVVVVDHADELAARARDAFSDALVVTNVHGRGLAGARNSALAHSVGDIVVFLDDDASAEPTWLDQLLAVYEDPRVIGAGGAVVPVWPAGRPRWFPTEFDWVVGCSWVGLPDRVAPVRNPIGASMSFRRGAFACAGLFTDGIGRGRRDAMGCEETEFTIRLRHARPESLVVYVPAAEVHHHLDRRRTSWTYFATRCHAEGRSKALVAGAVGTRDALASERQYSRKVLPAAVVQGLRDARHGDPSGVLRAATIVAGLGITAAGYAEGRVSARVRQLRG
ncbi:MAG TPA: glycosyltransferase family 2 protein [Acidimicrobiia bacterium]